MKIHMPRTGIIVLATVLFAGCSMLPQPIEPVDEEPVVIVPAPPSPAPEPAPPEPLAPVAPLPPVAIVMTSGQAAYADVAEELTKHFENHQIYDLSNTGQPPVTVLRLINDLEPGVVIAIGLRAAKSSVSMSEQPVVFSQVFNYRHHGLLGENSRGVASLPPLDAQLAAWKEVDPTVARIGMIVGEGHDDLISEARSAAEKRGIELVVQVTNSDQETLYYFRRMIRNIDGFWLLPDNRILSARVLREMFADAKRQRVPVSVPTDSMLSLGGMISMTTSAADIAESIVKVVRAIQAGRIDRVPAISPLSDIRVKTNGSGTVVQR